MKPPHASSRFQSLSLVRLRQDRLRQEVKDKSNSLQLAWKSISFTPLSIFHVHMELGVRRKGRTS